MENVAPNQGSPNLNSGGGQQDNSVLITILVLVGVFLIFRKKDKEKLSVIGNENVRIDSYQKFLKTNLGRNIDEQLRNGGMDLSALQIIYLDECFADLTDKEHKILKKGCDYTTKQELKKALTPEEFKIFMPIRKRIADCLDETINR